MENKWKSIEVNGSQWKSKEVNGSQWQSMEFNGSQWKSMEVNGSQCNSLKHTRNLMEVIWISWNCDSNLIISYFVIITYHRFKILIKLKIILVLIMIQENLILLSLKKINSNILESCFISRTFIWKSMNLAWHQFITNSWFLSSRKFNRIKI